MNLDQLLLQLKNGDENAFHDIYRLTKGAVYVCMRSFSKNKEDIKDLMQETYIKIYEKCHTYRSKGYPNAWIYKIAKNTAIDWSRRKDNNISLEICPEIPDTKAYTDGQDRLKDLIELAEKILNAKELRIVLLHTVGGLKHTEIAKLCKRPEGTIRWQYHSAIGKIRDFLEKSEGGAYEN